MSGTRAGGIKAGRTNKERHGEDFYKNIGHFGGSTRTDKPKGFAANRTLARLAGAVGGRRSKRGSAKK